MRYAWNDHSEWLETDGLGGFACGTVGGIRTRRYHGLLLAAATPPTQRFMLVNGVEVSITTPGGRFALSSQRYEGETVHPEGFKFIERFTTHPWPTWTFRLPDGTRIEQSIFVRHESPVTVLSWRVVGDASAVTLSVRPLVSGRDYHALHRENKSFNFSGERDGGAIRWRPYAGVPAIVAVSSGTFSPNAQWYRRFFYREESLRGFDAVEDLASPGEFTFDLSTGDAVLILGAQPQDQPPLPTTVPARELLVELRMMELTRRRRFASPLERAADQYIVRRGEAKSIIAGYPWFADWGRDTFIALRGLCLATNRLDDARAILVNWARYIRDGLVPNRFPDSGQSPEYNTVDASLWFVISALEFLNLVEGSDYFLPVSTRDMLLLQPIEDILLAYARGTRHGIRLDDDGLLAAGERGQQLTWMDARVDGREITPRIGKPVEIQALWLNALHLASPRFPRWRAILARGIESFRARFWNESRGCLYDVVDVDHLRGAVDPTIRPNQIFAVGGLPLALLEPDRAQRVVERVEEQLLTPLGLRSLAPDEPGYAPRYAGNGAMRDAVYHQGTVWPWLAGAFVEAWVRVRGSTDEAKRAARRRFLQPLMRHLNEAGLGHISEIADGEAPHMPRGCPFQAWSVAEALRLDLVVLRESGADASNPQLASSEMHPTAAKPRPRHAIPIT